MVFCFHKYKSLQLMSKMREQFSINDRLREYVERMLTVIIENNPQLLEVTTSSGVSINSMSMSSLPSSTPSQQSKPTTEIKSIPSKTLTPAASIKNETPSTTTKESADKYCRL